jgi:hypothetical protein
MITPEAYGSVQISLDTAFGDGHLWWNGAQWLAVSEDPRTATKEFQQVVAAARSQDAITKVMVAGAYYQIGNAQGRLGRDTQALTAYEEVLKRYSTDNDRALQGYVAAAMVARGNLFARKAHSGKPRDRPRVLQQALTEYRAVIGRYGGDPNPGMQVWVAEALAESAVAFGGEALNDKAMAVVYYDATIRRLIGHSGPIARRLTALAGLNAGLHRWQLGLRVDAISTTREMVAGFGGDSDPAALRYVASARDNLASWEGAAHPAAPPSTGDGTITPEAYGPVQISLDAFFGERRVWWNGTQWLAIPQDAKTATKELRNAVTAAGRSPDSATKVMLAGALFQIGNAQSRLGRETQSLSAHEDVLKWFAHEPDPVLQGYVAASMCKRALLFVHKAGNAKPNDRGRVLQQALAEYRAVIDRYSNDPSPGMQVWVANALVGSGEVFGGEVINNKAMAIVQYDAAMRVVSRHSGALASRLKATAGLNAGHNRAQLGLTADAIATTQAAVATAGVDLDPAILGYVATAQSNIASWQAPNQPATRTAAAKKPRSGAAGAVIFLVLIATAAGVLIAIRNAQINSSSPFSASSNGSLGSAGGSTGSNAGGNAGSNAGGNAGGSLTVPTAAAPAGNKPAWISLLYSCACPPTGVHSFTPTSFHGQLCPPSAFKFGYDKTYGTDLVFGGCSITTLWYVCATPGTSDGIIPPCAVDSSLTRSFLPLGVIYNGNPAGTAITAGGRPMDLVIYYCGTGDLLAFPPTVPSTTCLSP